MEEHKEVGAVGPQLLNNDGTSQKSIFFFTSLGREGARNFRFITKFVYQPDWERVEEDLANPVVVDWLSTACLLVKKQVFDEAGQFDKNYFLFYDDVDLFRRLKKTPWKAVIYPHGHVIHLGGGSIEGQDTMIKRLENTEYLRHAQHSLHYYFKKNHGIIPLVLLKAVELLASMLRIGLTFLRFLTFMDIRYKWLIVKYELHKIWLNVTRI